MYLRNCFALIDRADNVPSTDDRKQLEKDRTIQELKLNDYPSESQKQTTTQ